MCTTLCELYADWRARLPRSTRSRSFAIVRGEDVVEQRTDRRGASGVRLHITFPPDVPTHYPEQKFYFDREGFCDVVYEEIDILTVMPFES